MFIKYLTNIRPIVLYSATAMNTFRIHRVSKLTGLSRDVIRVWERRYGLLRPVRGPNRYRLYTDEDVALLRYLRSELDQGESIGELAALGREELLARMRSSPVSVPAEGEPYERLIGELIQALDPLDRAPFERRLNGAVAVIPFEEALHGILFPLQKKVGELWHDGRLGIAVEHYVTRQIQQKIFSVMNQLPVADQGPKIIVACPPGETHEVGAQAVAYRCRVRGCRVYYLGANVPIEALTNLCAQVHPALTLISFPVLMAEQEASDLARSIANHVTPHGEVAVGGDGAVAARALFERELITVVETFVELDDMLRELLFKRTASLQP